LRSRCTQIIRRIRLTSRNPVFEPQIPVTAKLITQRSCYHIAVIPGRGFIYAVQTGKLRLIKRSTQYIKDFFNQLLLYISFYTVHAAISAASVCFITYGIILGSYISQGYTICQRYGILVIAFVKSFNRKTEIVARNKLSSDGIMHGIDISQILIK